MALYASRREHDARALWRTFEDAVGGCPIPHAHQDQPSIDPDGRGCDWAPGMLASARILRAKRTLPECAQLCLAEAFFEQSAQVQLALLLHETIHVRLFLGRLQVNYRAIEDARGQTPNDNDDFVQRRWTLAMNALMFVQEVGADRIFRESDQHRRWWEVYLGERMFSYYRPDNPRALEEHGDPQPLKPYRVFYRLLRAELGLSVVDDPERRLALEQRRDYLQGRLLELAPGDATRLAGVQGNLLAVRVDTADPDPQSYTELFDEILRVEAPRSDR